MVKAIQKRTKKPLKFEYSDRGSKWLKRAAYCILGKALFCSARTCLRADEVALTEGGAFAGVPGPGVLDSLKAESDIPSSRKKGGQRVGVP